MAETVQLRDSGRRESNVVAPALWHRQLGRFPNTGQRYFYLAIVVMATVTLYYELYIHGGVGLLIIGHYHSSFPFFVYVAVIANAVGAFGSLFARLGRTASAGPIVDRGAGNYPAGDACERRT